MLKVIQLERRTLGSLPQVWGNVQDTELKGLTTSWGGSSVHLRCSPTSRVTELALTVERLQNQNQEKDRLNKALTEKLEALVRCSCPRDVAGREGAPTRSMDTG